MTDFPSTKKTFTQIVDGTNYTEATQMNQAYDEIEALETLIGSLGRDQTYSSSLKSLLSNYRNGCSVEYKGAADLYVRSGSIYIPDASGNGAYRQNTSDTTVNWTNIDTGSEANSTTYYVYAVADSAATTFTVKISTNATTPTGCTYYKKIGQFFNDSSGNIVVGAIGNYGYFPDCVAGQNLSLGTSWTDGTTYINDTGRKLLVVVNVVSSNSSNWYSRNVHAYIGSASADTEVAGTEGRSSSIDVDSYPDQNSFSFVVPNGWYWKINNNSYNGLPDATMTVEAWVI